MKLSNESIKVWTAVIVASLLGSQTAWGLDYQHDLLSLQGSAGQINQPSEFVYRNNKEETLIPVYLLGAVAKPGLYHIPIQSDVLLLLALAGGPLEGADTREILVRRGQDPSPEKIDLEKVISTPATQPFVLHPSDVVWVAPNKPAISQNTLATLTVITAVVGIVVSGFLIHQLTK
jgi:hypothetical protein